MKNNPWAVALLAAALCLPSGVSAASKNDAFSTFNRLVTGDLADGVWVLSEKTSVEDRSDDSSAEFVFLATTTNVGKDSLGVASFAAEMRTEDEDLPDVVLTLALEGRTVKGKDYLRLNGGSVMVNDETIQLSSVDAASGSLGKWADASLGEAAAAEGAASAFEAIEALGKKDASYSVSASVDGGSTVTAKIGKKSRFAKEYPLLAGATVTIVTGSDGAVRRVDVAASGRNGSASFQVSSQMSRVGDAPLGTVIAAPGGKLADFDDIAGVVGTAIAEVLIGALPPFESALDGFAIKFAGYPEFFDSEDEDGNPVHYYEVVSDSYEEWVQAVVPMYDGDVGEFEVSEDAFDGQVQNLETWYKKNYGKKNVVYHREIDIEGYEALRTVVFNRKTQDYIAYADLTTEYRNFEIAAAAATQAEAEARLDRMLASFEL